MRKLIIGILIVILTSCRGNTALPQATSWITPLASPTVSPSLTQVPTLTFVYTPDIEEDVLSMKDLKPTPILTPTPVPLSDYYDLPAWMKNRETNIAAALITNDIEKTRKIAFFNVSTEEKYEILIPENIGGYFWYDNENFGFLTIDLQTAFRLNLTSGQVTSELVPSQSVRLLEPDGINNIPNGLNIIKESTLNPNITFTTTWQPNISK